jgi:teichuronic acid biosynthesis glycosyltransferase TuaH
VRIVLLSHTGRTGPFRVGSHHFAREFARMGHRVAHISNPVSVAHVTSLRDTEIRNRMRSALPMQPTYIDGVAFAVPWSMLPLGPNPAHDPVMAVSMSVLRRRLKAAGMLPADLILIDQPLFHFLLDELPHDKVIYRPTDINTAPAALKAENHIMKAAAGVVATSHVVVDRLERTHALRASAVVENGVEFDHFAKVSKPWAERSGAVYVGALDRRFDWAAIDEFALAEPTQTIDIYGPLPMRVPDLPSNVRLAGSVDYARLPELLANHRVGLLPLNDEPTNDGRSPMKLYEYLAAGLAVVSRATAPIDKPGLRDVHTYADMADAAEVYREALAADLDGDGLRAARAKDWSARARAVLDACARMTGTAPLGHSGDSTDSEREPSTVANLPSREG